MTPLQHVLSWTLLQNWWPVFEPFVGPVPTGSFLFATTHLWSLAVEEQFYLLWPLAVQLCTVRALRRLCIAIILATPLIRALLVVLPGAGPEAAYVMTIGRMDGLALGALLAFASRDPVGLVPWRRAARIAAPISLGLLLTILASRDSLGTMTGLFLVLGLSASVCLGGCAVIAALTASSRDRVHRGLTSAPLRAIGRYSYTVYVIHLPLAYVCERSGILRKPMVVQWLTNPLAAELGYSVILMAACIAVGAISWHFYERPILSFRRFLPYHVSRDTGDGRDALLGARQVTQPTP